MDTTKLGPLNVSRLCLGTMLMGGKTPPEEAHRMLDRFVAAGGNFIDTADTYIDGESERTLAPWLADHRDEVVVATKVRFAVSDPGGEGLAPDRIRAACDASLKRLGIDVIDLYQVHAPDPSVPLEDTLEALDGLVDAPARCARSAPPTTRPGCSRGRSRCRTATAGRRSCRCSRSTRSSSARSRSRSCRSAAPPGSACSRGGRSAPGFLTGKYSRDTEPPEGSRMADATDDIEEARHRRAIERNFRVVDEAEAIAAERGATVSQVALAWLLGEPGVVAPIVGPRTFEQLEDLLGAADLRLTDEERERLAAPAPPPVMYPQRMLREQTGLDELAQLRR